MSITTRATRGRFVLFAALALGGLAACGDDDRPTATTPTTAPAGLADGTHTAFLAAVTDDGVTVDPAVMLSGEEAVEAAREDGALPADGTLPNDFYIDNDGVDEIVLTFDAGATVELLDCTGGCEHRAVDRSAFVSGEVEPFGGEHALVELDLSDGAIVRLREIYVP